MQLVVYIPKYFFERIKKETQIFFPKLPLKTPPKRFFHSISIEQLITPQGIPQVQGLACLSSSENKDQL